VKRIANSKWIAAAALFLAFAAASAAQTKLYLHDAASDVSGYKEATVSLGPANTTAVTNTVASGTDIQVTKTGGGATVAWITAPFQTAVTISGTVTCNVYGGESATSANAAFRCRLYKYSGGSEGATFMTANMTTELNTSTTTVRNWTGTPTSTSFAAGDRLVIKMFLENCATSGCPTGTMAGSQTVTLGYNGTTAGSNAASYVQTTENLVVSPAPSETLTTSDSCATSTCRAVGEIETYVGSDAVAGAKSGSVASVSETLTTTGSVSISRSVNAGNFIGDATYCLLPNFPSNFGLGPCNTPGGNGVGENFSTRNDLLQSQALNLSPWIADSTADHGETNPGPPTVTGNAAVAPDSSTTATELDFPATTTVGTTFYTFSDLYQDVATGSLSGRWSFSVWLKGNSPGLVGVELFCADPGVSENDIYAAVDVTTSWQRFTISANLSNGFDANTFAPVTNACSGSGTTATVDIWSSEMPSYTVYAWGAQLQPGAIAGTYALTTTSAALATPGTVARVYAGIAAPTVILTTTDSCSRVRCVPVGEIETHVGTDSVAAGGSIPYSASVSETLTTTATVTTSSPSTRGVLETISSTDSCATSTCRAVSVIETHVGKDAVVWGHSLLASVTETYPTQANVHGYHSGITVPETISISDSAVAIKNQGSVVSESYPTTATVTAVKETAASLTESYPTADLLTALRCGAIPENLTTVDLVSAVKSHQVSISESLSVTDSTSGAVGRSVNESEATAVSDSAATVSALNVSITNTLATVDGTATSTQTPNSINLSETESTTDFVVVASQQNVDIENTYTPADEVGETLAATAALTESISMVDSVSVSTSLNYFAALTESLTTVDAASEVRAINSSIFESTTAFDSVASVFSRGASVSESTTTVDVVGVSAVYHKTISISETTRESDAVGAQAPFTIGLGDAVNTMDAVSAFVQRAGERRRFIVIETP